MKKLNLKVALIGAGGIGRDQHLPAWLKLPGVTAVALADVSPDALASVGKQFEIKHRFTDYRELLERNEIDVVDICVPSALHAEVTIAALQAGKHVLCEKPMATSAADAQAMLAAAEASGKKLMINQHMRFDPRSKQLARWLRQNPAGDIYYARCQWMRRRRLPGKPSFTEKRLSGGGPLLDIGVHVFDLAWWLMGCPQPLRVSASTNNQLARREDLGSEWGNWNPEEIDVEDFAVGLVHFAGGATLLLETSWLALQQEQETISVNLFGTQAGVQWPSGMIVGEKDAEPWDLKLPDALGERAHHESVRQFAQAIARREPSPIPPEQSAQVVTVLEAMYRSAAEGREVALS